MAEISPSTPRSNASAASDSEPPKKKLRSDDDLYRNSSQFRFWSFTESQLRDTLNSRNQEGCRAVELKTEKAKSQHSETPAVEAVDCLTVDEEEVLVQYYSRKAMELCKYFRLSTQVRNQTNGKQATAIAYLRRFYLKHSTMMYNPKNVLPTCLFLAAKTENSLIPVKDFAAAIPKTSVESVLNLEFLILQTLQFTLLVHHPYRPLYGFFLDLQATFRGNSDVAIEKLGSLHDKARDIIHEGLFSNAPFMFTPPQIALAAALAANEGIILQYLNIKYKEKADGFVDELLEVVRKCQKVLLDVKPVASQEEIKRIGRKLHYCHKPEDVLFPVAK